MSNEAPPKPPRPARSLAQNSPSPAALPPAALPLPAALPPAALSAAGPVGNSLSKSSLPASSLARSSAPASSLARSSLSGKEYADLIAAYLTRNYGEAGLVVYREVSLGKSIIGKNRKIDLLCVHQPSQRAVGIECKFQGSQGTADEKIPYTLADLEAMHVPAFVAYAGEGFSVGVVHMLESHRLAAYCLPTVELSPSKETVELDHVIAMTFGWWDRVLARSSPFSLAGWTPPRSSEPSAPLAPTGWTPPEAPPTGDEVTAPASDE